MTSTAVTQADSRDSARERRVWEVLADVPDPEIPVLSVVDLGIVRYVRFVDARLAVGVSPTYTGCPATEVIHTAIREALADAGYVDAMVESVLSPPWTSDWLSESGREKLRHYGIAPPAHAVGNPKHLLREPLVACPRCESSHTQRVSEFASTPCKALYRCLDCLEPFEYFKCI